MTALDIAMLIALSAIWGASYLFIRVAGPAMATPRPLTTSRTVRI